jgi:ubiquinone/menaquinone biosynthesis C-methylase UbiE
MVEERERIYKRILMKRFETLQGIQFLEIGAGAGANIPFFKSVGIPPGNIFANEMLEDRLAMLKKNHPDINVIEGNALNIPEKKFDVVFQSTVFTSILDDSFRRALARKMVELTKPGGIILWYDFMFNNPENPDVRKVTKNDIKELFHGAAGFRFYRVTLAPPIGRKVGKLYPFFNLFPFLRTHIIAEIKLT